MGVMTGIPGTGGMGGDRGMRRMHMEALVISQVEKDEKTYWCDYGREQDFVLCDFFEVIVVFRGWETIGCDQNSS